MSYTYFKTLEGFWQLSVHIHAAKKGHNVWKWSKMYHMNFQWFHTKITFLQMFEFLRQNCTCESCELRLFWVIFKHCKGAESPIFHIADLFYAFDVCVCCCQIELSFFQEENCIKRLGFLLLQETRTKLSSPAVRRKVLWQYSLGIFPSVTLFVYD